MALIYIFAGSGLAILLIIVAKMMEDRFARQNFLLRGISKGDRHARAIYHKLAHQYVEGKEKWHHYLTKQAPMRMRNLSNKLNVFIREKLEERVGNIRNSKFLKRSEGISEFFKSLSEKDSGRIDDIFESSKKDENQVD